MRFARTAPLLIFCALGSVAAAETQRVSDVFDHGRTAARHHSMDLLGQYRGGISPPGATMGTFFGKDDTWRAAYAAGVVYEYHSVSGAFNRPDAADCFRRLYPVSLETLDAIWFSGQVTSPTSMVATVRRICVPDRVLMSISGR